MLSFVFSLADPHFHSMVLSDNTNNGLWFKTPWSHLVFLVILNNLFYFVGLWVWGLGVFLVCLFSFFFSFSFFSFFFFWKNLYFYTEQGISVITDVLCSHVGELLWIKGLNAAELLDPGTACSAQEQRRTRFVKYINSITPVEDEVEADTQKLQPSSIILGLPEGWKRLGLGTCHWLPAMPGNLLHCPLLIIS